MVRVRSWELVSIPWAIASMKRDPKKLQEAVDKLYTLTPNIKALVADEMKGYMIQNNAAIGVTFSGEASQMLDANKDLRYVESN